MFQSPILDVAAGLVLVFLVLALVCTSINESIAQILSLRAEVLFRAVSSLFQNSGDAKAKQFAQQIFDHDLIDALSPPGSNPSYIPSHIFSLALVDRLGLHTDTTVAVSGASTAAAAAVGAPPAPTVAELLDKARESQKDGDPLKIDDSVFKTLRPLAVAAGNSIDTFRLNIENWFDAAMQRAGGWYKKKVQVIIFFVALAVALVFNIDSLMITNTLWSNSAARTQLETTSAALAKATPPGQIAPPPSLSSPAVIQARSQVMSLIGWAGPIDPRRQDYKSSDTHAFPAGFGAWIGKLIGLLISAMAACLGAPFWFGVLSKIMDIRNAGASPSDPKATQPNRIASTGGN